MTEAGEGPRPLAAEVERNIRETAAVQGFLRHIGFKLDRVAAGFAQSSIVPGPEHAQQDRFVHGGVLATMADVTGGCAALSLAGSAARVLTVELKISFLEPAVGERILCRARVLRQGKRLSIVEAELIALEGGRERQAAKALATYAVREGKG